MITLPRLDDQILSFISSTIMHYNSGKYQMYFTDQCIHVNTMYGVNCGLVYIVQFTVQLYTSEIEKRGVESAKFPQMVETRI